MAKSQIETWYQRSWRPMMAFLYLTLCLLDYGVRPAINFYFFKQFNLVQTVESIQNLDSAVQIQIIEVLRKNEAIQPILPEFVHLAFGAILGVAAYSRGKEKESYSELPTVLPTRKPKQVDDDESDSADNESPVG